MATAIVPGPVVNGMVSGKKATSSSPAACDACSCFLLFVLLRPLQEHPGARSDDEAAGDPKRREADAEEVQDIGAAPERAEHDENE